MTALPLFAEPTTTPTLQDVFDARAEAWGVGHRIMADTREGCAAMERIRKAREARGLRDDPGLALLLRITAGPPRVRVPGGWL